MNKTGKGIVLSVFFCFILLNAVSVRLLAQDTILSSYERSFIRASLSEKPGILRDAVTDEKSREFIGSLYEFALRFALTNGEYLREDPDMIALVGTAAKGAGVSGNLSSVKSLWELFQIFQDPHSRAEILGSLALLGKGNKEVIGNLNKFLEDQNNIFRNSAQRQASGRPDLNQDYPVIRACILALGILGDNSSFPYLFSAMTAGYPQTVTQETLKALESIQGNYKDYLVDIIRKNPFAEKAAAFRIGAYNERLSVSERGEIAQAALEVSLESSGPFETSLRYDAVTVLTRLKWSPAAGQAIRNFYRVQTDFTNSFVPRERLIEAIACLGVMGSSEAARALALQLGYFNSQTEKTGEYDETVILALVNALGELGDKAAFDYLLYIGYLNYPDKIQAAARDALNRLRW